MRAELSFLQTNLNHCAGAQDLLLQSMAEWEIDLAVTCEPYYVPPLPYWAGDLDGTVAVLTRHSQRNRAAVARQSPNPILVLSDLNAKSRAWGNPAMNLRGRAVQVWALLSGLSLLNKGQAHTCVRHNGVSVVDVSFATLVVARRVSEWRVEEEVETLSDHPGRREGTSVEELAGRMSRALKEVCDVAMPRTRRRAQRRHVYWWSPKIAELRATCNQARLAYVRCRRRNGLDVDLEGQLLAAYCQLKKDFGEGARMSEVGTTLTVD
ncbi:uncharacterized protein LOC126774754 [Nymphalis io]|uniref:uncharacterized protein LOC126774754 n=1 Tax=Inachis io TaxID=171585 RepID=UPI0021691B5C|nr:uncharacterized protein LOC126774754 [Nymphalis io]